ncbi:major outer membrane protein OmpA [gut metagenome]|uniref:Major outer membrane protein OmpA n=1 Tax=gut metagenome TaxID=749906 RepID=J9CZB1_9ZZZZ
MTPSVGLRIGYQGITGRGWSYTQLPYAQELNDNGFYKKKFGTAYFHGDVMWNISNAFSGYKETRTWNFVPFLSAGIAHSYRKGIHNNEFAIGVGLLNNIRISNRVDLTLEARQLVVRQGYDSSPMGGLAGMGSVTFGVSVKLGRTGFKRSHEAEHLANIANLNTVNTALVSDNDNLKDQNEQLKDENEALKAKVEELEARPAEVEKKVLLNVTPGAVFFEIGQTSLSPQELFHLDFYLQNVIAQEPERVFVLTGYADKQTGSKKRNQQLSEMRVEYVYNLLKEKYNVPAERLEIKASGSEVDRWGDALLNRCVVIE